MNCPLCKSHSQFVLEAKGYPIHDCVSCKHRFAAFQTDADHVASAYGDSYFFGGGAGYPDYLAEGDLLRSRGRSYAKKMNRFLGPGRILDVGAAAGFILKGFQDEGWEGIGLEPNESMVAIGAKLNDVVIEAGTLETFDHPSTFDLVSMIQVIAHLHNPTEAISNIRNLLADEGYLLVESWDRHSLTARSLGKHWHEYSPPSVLHWFSKQGLILFLDNMGFSLVKAGRPVKFISGRHARSLLEYRIGRRWFLKILPDSIRIPYPAEDLFWMLFKKR